MDLGNLEQYAEYAYSTKPTILNTATLTRQALYQEGSLVECGVAAGAQVGVMGQICKDRNDKRKIYVFDSFEGIPMACERDEVQPGIEGFLPRDRKPVENKRNLLVSSGVSSWSLEKVQENIKRWDLNLEQFEFCKGWFQDTLPVIAPKIDKIALLRLDGDLYESTKVCLEYLHNKVVRGGYVIIDDYALKGCRDACNEYWKKHSLNYSLIEVLDGGGPVWYKI